MSTNCQKFPKKYKLQKMRDIWLVFTRGPTIVYTTVGCKVVAFPGLNKSWDHFNDLGGKGIAN